MQFDKNILEAKFEDILGQDQVKNQLKSTLLARRNVILVGQPGIGKTTMAKNIAKILPDQKLVDSEFHSKPDNPMFFETEKKTRKFKGEELFVRVQGSPDLTAEDLIGDIDPIKAMKYGPLSVEAFTPGKIFKANNGILFFDEVNRCSEKLQNALLQTLEEKKVTIGSYSIDFDVDFIFIGTMNPDDSSTEPLSDVFLDRFDLIYVQYPEKMEMEMEIVKIKGKNLANFSDKLLEPVIKFIRNLRVDENIDKKPSVRASIGIYERAQTNALVNGRTDVTPHDVSDVVVSVLSHRMSLKPSVKYLQKIDDYIRSKYETYVEDLNDASDYL